MMLSRRKLLRGAVRGAAVSVALPALEVMLDGNGAALAGGRPLPKRMGVFFWGNGVRLDRWNPRDRGRDWTLSDELAPLAPVRDYVSVISGMQIKTGNEQGHHAGSVGILSGRPMVSQPHPTSAYASTFSGPSIDQVAADVIGKGTRFRSLELGVSRHVTDNEGTTLTCLSHRGPDNPNPAEFDPAVVFDRLFGSGESLGVNAPSALASERAIGRSVLDVVAEDARLLGPKVSGKDRQRLEQHFQNIREIEARVTRPGPRCEPGAFPGVFTEVGGKEPIEEIHAAMSRLVTLALSCDLTRVFSLQFSGSVATTVYWQVGEDKPHHQLTHDEAGDQPMVHAATVFVMRQFARLLEDLAETPDGAGNLLDSCGILASSDTAEGKEHTLKDYPILLAGRAGGKLKHPGLHYRSDSHENASQVLLTLLRAVGVPLDDFGAKGGHVESGVSAVEV
jgi:hypothetical protein